jgi:hypothetical protein
MLSRDMLKLIWWVVIGLFRAAEKRRSESGLSLEASYFGLCAGTEDKKEGSPCCGGLP